MSRGFVDTLTLVTLVIKTYTTQHKVVKHKNIFDYS